MDDSRKHTRPVGFGGNAVKFELDSLQLLEAVDTHFAHCLGGSEPVVAEYQVGAVENAHFSIVRDGREFVSSATADQVLFHLMQDGLTQLNGAATANLVFHAAGLARQDRGLLLCGRSGCGKSTLAAWLTVDGFQYLSDEVIASPLAGGLVSGFCRSLVLKRGSASVWEHWLPAGESSEVSRMDDGSVWITPTLLNPSAVRARVDPHVVLFPSYSTEAEFTTEQLSPANTLFMLMQCLVNARNLPDHGMTAAKELSQRVTAYKLTYSDLEQASEWIQKTIAM